MTPTEEPHDALVPLGQVCDINPPKPKLAAVSDDTAVLFVPMAAVDEVSGEVTEEELRPLGEVRTKSYTAFAPGDILFAKITPCMENGKAAVVPTIESGLGFGSTEFHVLRPRPGTNAKYIWHLMRQQRFRDLAEEHMTGSVGQARVPATFLHEFRLSLPDETTQETLASLLDEVTSRTRTVTSRIARARKTLIRARAATLAAACAGELTAAWRSRHQPSEDAAALLARIEAGRQVRLGRRFRSASVPEAPFELPVTWTWTTIGALLDVATGATPLRSNREFYGGQIPWVTSGAVNAGNIRSATEFITARALAETNTKIFPKGTLLLAMYGEGQTRGKVAELAIDAATNQAVAALLFHKETEILRPYLRLFLLANYERIRQLSFGGVQPNLSLGVVRDTAVPLPPVEEQTEICVQAERLLDTIGRAEQRFDVAARAARRAVEAVSALVFDGRLVELASEAA